MNNDITVILNVYNRGYTLEEQLTAIYNQSVKIPDENIWVWYNKGTAQQSSPKNNAHKIFVCNHNTKFHGRFAVANLVQTKYVALFDDDTMPGKDWFKNCLESIEICNGILGGSGVILNHIDSTGKVSYPDNYKIGWNGSHDELIKPVDLVGHAWFLKQDWIQYMWREKPASWDNGEDIMFSYLCQKYGGIKTYVPPHPSNNRDMWANIVADKYGSDQNATYIYKTDHYDVRSNVCTSCRNNGWKLVHFDKQF